VHGYRQKLVRLSVFGLIVLGVVLPWYWYSWRHLGGFLPDTLLIKRGQRLVWYGYSFGDGLALFYKVFPLAVVASFVLLPVSLLVLWNRTRPVRLVAAALLIYGLLHYVAYSALAVPPYHWYYTPEIVVVTLLAAFGLATWWQLGAQHRVAAAGLLGAVLVVSVTAVVRVPDGELPIHSNWATAEEYRAVGLWLSSSLPATEVIRVSGEVGTVGYWSGRTTVNDFTDVDIATRGIRRGPDAHSKGLLGALIRLNIRHRPTPPPIPPPTYSVVFVNQPAKSWTIVHEWDAGTRWRPGVKCYLIRL
jgi:hypothetical protein